MGLTKSERHNRMLEKVMGEYKKNLKDPVIKSYKRHSFKMGNAVKDRGVDYPGPKSRSIAKAKK